MTSAHLQNVMMLTFGPFKLDDHTLELWRDGRPVSLRPQPCRLLTLLAARPGELVTREQLAEALWPGTHVHFNLGINSCLKQIRSALGDDAQKPRWIETLSRRGYRFIGAVRRDESQPPARLKRLLVLPVRAMPPCEAIAQPFVSALTDEMEIRLARMSATVSVIAGASLPPGLIAQPSLRALSSAGVDLLLDCRVHVSAPAVRIAAQLVDAVDRTMVWADMFDGSIDDSFGTQRTVARAVVQALHAQLEPAPARLLAG